VVLAILSLGLLSLPFLLPVLIFGFPNHKISEALSPLLFLTCSPLNNTAVYIFITSVVLASWFLPKISHFKMQEVEFDLAAPPALELSPARMSVMLASCRAEADRLKP